MDEQEYEILKALVKKHGIIEVMQVISDFNDPAIEADIDDVDEYSRGALRKVFNIIDGHPAY